MNIDIDFTKGKGLIPVIIQDIKDNDVLMLGYMNDEAFILTINTGYVHYWSRSKKRIWQKGESSGHVQIIKEIRLDCDNDTLLIKVEQQGGSACHEGYKSCFFKKFVNGEIITDKTRISNPEEMYKD